MLLSVKVTASLSTLLIKWVFEGMAGLFCTRETVSCPSQHGSIVDLRNTTPIGRFVLRMASACAVRLFISRHGRNSAADWLDSAPRAAAADAEQRNYLALDSDDSLREARTDVQPSKESSKVR